MTEDNRKREWKERLAEVEAATAEAKTAEALRNDEFDITELPAIVNAVLDLMPNGQMWRARFAGQPGLAVKPADPDGWLTVQYQGDDVMRLHVDIFKRGAPLGDAQVMINGQWVDVVVEREGGQ